MAVALALLSAVAFGVGDFCGGMATKRARVAAVLLWSHGLGVVLLVVTVGIDGGSAGAGDLALGAVGGLAGAAGVALLYQGLSVGPMSVVAPVTALLSAAVPVIAGFAKGERPSVTVVAGMVAGLVAIVFVSAEGEREIRISDWRGLTYSLGAGLGFGLFFVSLSYTDDGSGAWPLLAARVTSVSVVGVLALGGVLAAARPTGRAGALTLAAGALDVTANVLYLLAIREGLLSVGSVLASLYPVSTVLLARAVLGERFSPVQRIGVAIALPATALMAT